MNSLKPLAWSLAAALPLLLAFGNVMASAQTEMPGPGIFGLIALGVVGTLAIARSRN